MASTQLQLPKPRTHLHRPKLRAIAFQLHRWLGLTVGILLSIAGVTGSILVFWHEIDHWWLTRRFGAIIPTDTQAAIPAIITQLKTTYIPKTLTLTSLYFPTQKGYAYVGWLKDAADHYLQVFVNPYTGQIMGDRQWETSWVGRIYELHYKLLAGDIGVIIVGVVALLTLILSLTGIVLWPGWRKLAAGFKIKWDGHIKRRNFDLHKVAGIIAAIFLALIGFTGFAWNIPQAKVTEAIYAATFTPKAADPASTPIPGKSPLAIADLIQRADAVMPKAKTTYISFAKKPEEVFQVGKKQTQENGQYGNTSVVLDQFSGKVLQLQDGMKPNRAEAIINQFVPLHFGTFGGVPTKILYVLVGLAPLILFITGLIMWWYRKKSPKVKPNDRTSVPS